MIKNVDQLADRLKGIKVEGKELTFDTLKDIISNDKEIELEVTPGTFMTDEGLNSLKETVKKQGYEEARTPIKEMTLKELKRKAGLEFEGKDEDTFISKFKETILSEAKLPADKKITELSQSLENLQKQYQKDIELKDQMISQKENALKDTIIESRLTSLFPKDIILKPSHAAKIMKMDFQIDLTESGDLQFSKGGQVLKDKFEKPIPIDSIVSDYVVSNKWLPASDGRGGDGGEPGNGEFKTINDLMKFMEQNNIDPTSQKGEKLLKEFNA